MSRPPLLVLTLALLWAFAPAVPALGQDEPAAEPTPDTPAGSPEADAPQQEVTPDEKTDDEQPPAEEPAADKPATDASEKPAADEPDAEAESKITPELLVENLETPTGLAIAPQSGDVMIATRWGVYRYVPQTHAIFIEVEGYDVPDTIGEDGEIEIGPLSLAFYGDSELVVGGGSAPEGEELVQTFEIGLEPRGDDAQIQDTDTVQTAGPVDAATAGGEGAGNFTGVLVGEKGVYVSTSGTTPKGWILKVPTEEGKFGEIEPFIATSDVAKVGGPGPMAWDGDGNLVVGLWGGAMPGDDAIGVFNDAGELRAVYKGDIGEFGGMAYSPKTNALYVTDMGLSTDRGGLYKVTLADEKIQAEKILALDKPAGLAFSNDGKLYLTTLGTPEEGKTTPDGEEFSPGALHLIDAGL
ncbi:hypothetical protein [Alienimonas chondri]|uniref:SMP-30/Gluconolactonase/LRE-like region domain-containing protein n=1 Tax=Alienimonas chondri TaxID=2681879 RepID=A0ABX1VAF5_9PLAN|nr:hypothetical protein [Alienimonas chondri]NNJ25077.1 hypothetical protein [Alienimonas chondri]